MTPIADLLAARTAFGGLSAALALHAARALEPDLPPLRSAQIAFIGPLAGKVAVQAVKLRRGRNAAFVQADVTSEAGLGLRATFVFMAALTSAVSHDTAPRSAEPAPPRGAKTYIGPDSFFTGNFEFIDLPAATGPAEWRRWVRLRARDDLDPLVELMAIGDALPPAAMKLFGSVMVPLSSLNWQINFLTPAPITENGWWLLTAATDFADNGYSSQRMTIANAAGEPVAEAMQGVAIFA